VNEPATRHQRLAPGVPRPTSLPPGDRL